MVVTAVGMPAWVLSAFGLVQIQACAPASWTEAGWLGGAHLALMRPVSFCTSGFAFETSALTLVGTVALATMLAWATGAGALAWFGALLARCARRIGALLRPLRTRIEVPALVALPTREALRRPVPAREARLPRWVRIAVVGWRAPPVAA